MPTLSKTTYMLLQLLLTQNIDLIQEMNDMDWYYSFLIRHPEISPSRAKEIFLSKITALNKEQHFRFDAEYNVDDTGQRNLKIFASKCLKQMG